MSLASRVTALAQAIGADIKALRTDVTALQGQGSSSGITVYEQPTQPSTTEIGAIWIKG